MLRANLGKENKGVLYNVIDENLKLFPNKKRKNNNLFPWLKFVKDEFVTQNGSIITLL